MTSAQRDRTRSPALPSATATTCSSATPETTGCTGTDNNDVLNGGSGTDFVSGGSGYDTALVDYDVFTRVFDEDLNIEVIVY